MLAGATTPVAPQPHGDALPAPPLVTVIVVVIADQVTKTLAVEHLASGPVHIIGPVSLALGYNSGVAFSLGTGARSADRHRRVHNRFVVVVVCPGHGELSDWRSLPAAILGGSVWEFE